MLFLQLVDTDFPPSLFLFEPVITHSKAVFPLFSPFNLSRSDPFYARWQIRLLNGREEDRKLLFLFAVKGTKELSSVLFLRCSIAVFFNASLFLSVAGRSSSPSQTQVVKRAYADTQVCVYRSSTTPGGRGGGGGIER